MAVIISLHLVLLRLTVKQVDNMHGAELIHSEGISSQVAENYCVVIGPIVK